MIYSRLNGWLLTAFLHLIIHSNGFRCPASYPRNSLSSVALKESHLKLRMSATSDSEGHDNSLSVFWKKSVRSAMGLVISCSMLGPYQPPVHAEEWTDKNRLAAEAWRAVDEIYYDRTFNGNDWFKLRQEIVKRDYNTDEDVYKSIATMLTKLGDKYTRFLAPAQYTALMNSAQGELTGVGLELQGLEDGKIRIVNIEDESPAKDSGIIRGDIIMNVDGTDTKGLSPEEVAAIIRGKKDTKASLRLARDGKEIDFTVVRKPFRLKGVSFSKATISGKPVGLITLKSFNSNTRDDVMHALEELHKSGDKDDLKAIVLDMRNNGGGLLQAAVETANLVLPPGKIVVFVVSKDGLTEAQQTLPNGIPSNDPSLPDLDTPLYVLVNSNTASAAEVLAAALKENGRAKLVGEKTFGKGVIQNLQELRQGGIAVTIAKYETPLHNNINKIGIAVDVPVECEATLAVDVCAAKFL